MQFEYKVFWLRLGDGRHAESILNPLGAERWQVVVVQAETILMMREKLPPPVVMTK
jgi:hypothetical protein